MVVRLSALRTGSTLLPRNISFLFLVLISVNGFQGVVRPEGLGKLKEFSHLTGSRIRDFPACSTVLQPLRYPKSLAKFERPNKHEHIRLSLELLMASESRETHSPCER
jgi:hypothetical protein